MHPVIEFYLNQRKTPQGFSLQELWHLPDSVIGDGYFYIPWLFPANRRSKWNSRVPLFSEQDCEIFSRNLEIQQRFLTSFDSIIHYFGIEREENELHIKNEIIERKYWLRNVGHETKKISRLINSLDICGQPILAKNLQQLAIRLGSEKGHLLPDTLEIWNGLIK